MQKARSLVFTSVLCLIVVTVCASMSLARANDAEQENNQAPKNLYLVPKTT